MKYLKRLLISAFTFLILFSLVLITRYFINSEEIEIGILDFILASINEKLVIIFIAFVFVYPVYSFGNKKRYIQQDYNYNKEAIEKVFEDFDYKKVKETDEKIYFQKATFSKRLINMFLDEIELSIDDNPIVFNGRRRELQKINQTLDKSLL